MYFFHSLFLKVIYFNNIIEQFIVTRAKCSTRALSVYLVVKSSSHLWISKSMEWGNSDAKYIFLQPWDISTMGDLKKDLPLKKINK